MKSFIQALLPGLEEETGEYFDKARHCHAVVFVVLIVYSGVEHSGSTVRHCDSFLLLPKYLHRVNLPPIVPLARPPPQAPRRRARHRYPPRRRDCDRTPRRAHPARIVRVPPGIRAYQAACQRRLRGQRERLGALDAAAAVRSSQPRCVRASPGAFVRGVCVWRRHAWCSACSGAGEERGRTPAGTAQRVPRAMP